MSSASAYASASLDDYLYVEDIGKRLDSIAATIPADVDKIVEALATLRRVIKMSFTIEENYMNDVSYPNVRYHKRSHAFILGELTDTIDSIMRCQEGPGQGLWVHFASRLKVHQEKYGADLQEFLASAPIPAAFEEVVSLPSRSTSPSLSAPSRQILQPNARFAQSTRSQSTRSMTPKKWDDHSSGGHIRM